MKTKFVTIFIFCAFAVAHKESRACEIIKSYKSLDLHQLGTLKHEKAHYESKYLSSYMYAKDPSSAEGLETKNLFYPYMPDNYCKKTNDAKKEYINNYYSHILSAQAVKTTEIIATNNYAIKSKMDNFRYVYSFPYVISYDSIDEDGEKRKYAVLTYNQLFDYLRPYIGDNSEFLNEEAIKDALGVTDLNVWKFFIINQLMVGLNMIYRAQHLHKNIGVNSVMLRSKTEAGWFDTDQIQKMYDPKRYKVIVGMVKKYDKKQRPYIEPKDYQFKRYKDYKLYYNQEPYSEIHLKNHASFYYASASNVAAFAILIINMFAPGFGTEFQKTENTTLKDFFESYCVIKHLKGDLVCTHMKELISRMLSIDLKSTVGIDTYHAEFVSVMLEILKADKSAVPLKNGKPSLSDDEASRLRTSVDSFQENFDNMVTLRIQDKLDNCQKMPLKKTFVSHTISFLLDNHNLQEEVTACKPKYGRNIQTILKESTEGVGFDRPIDVNSDFYTDPNYSCYVKIAERFKTEICMKAFFEDEAHIFAPYHEAKKNLKEFITAALPVKIFKDDILDIWVKAIENGLNQFLSQEII